MKPPEIIETKRLFLRRWTKEDAEAIFAAYAQDQEVTKYLTWQPHRTIEETRTFVEGRIAAWETGNDFAWGIRLHSEPLIGGIALRLNDFKVDLGYVIARAYWGKGFATEAVQALVDWALKQPQIVRVWATCDIENPASAKVMEKVGMIREGILRKWLIHPQAGETPRDCLCYSIVRE